MKILLTIVIGLGVLIAALLFVASSMCAFASGFSASGRMTSATIALVSLAVMLGGVYAIARLNKNDSHSE
jgi:hypothetical protein